MAGVNMRKVFLIIVSSLLLAGCGGSSEPAKEKPAPAQAANSSNSSAGMSKTEKLHQKAKVAEAASLVGYDGKDIRKKLDTIIDANAEHEKMLKDVGGH